MTEAAAFRATFCDWRLVKTRGVVQVVFEVPIQDADHAYQALGGMPDYSQERWFGIAALNVAGPGAQYPVARGAGGDPGGTSAPRRSVAPEKMLAQQAGMACADPRFQEFSGYDNEAGAAIFVRNQCYVSSRAEIRPGTEAGDRWEELYQEFLRWRADQDMGEA